MSLVDKYRPSTFNDVVGQKHIMLDLKNVVGSSVPPVIILSGPPGCGKTTTARLIAAKFNCKQEDSPCGVCDSCKAVSSKRHINVTEIDAPTSGSVENMRQYVYELSFPPTNGVRVLIVDEAHKMSSAAASALLAPTEELPDFSCVILATTDEQALSDALKSRAAYHGRFTTVAPDNMRAHLTKIAELESFNVVDSVFDRIVALSGGKVRNALNFLEACAISANGEQVTMTTAKHILMFDVNMLIYVMILRLMQGEYNKAMDVRSRALSLASTSKDMLSSWVNTESEIIAQAHGGPKLYPEEGFDIVANNAFNRLLALYRVLGDLSYALSPDAQLNMLFNMFSKQQFLINSQDPVSAADVVSKFS